MRISPNVYKISLILISLLINGTLGDIGKLLSPWFWMDRTKEVIDQFNPFSPKISPTTTTETTVICSTPNPTEEAIFNLAYKIQSFYNPSDLQAKENYIISPISAAMLLGELLLGTYGETNDCLVKILGLSRRLTRGAGVFTETTNGMYDPKMYHPVYHYQLCNDGKNHETDAEQDKIKFNNALFCTRDADIVEAFKSKMNKFYTPDFIPIDLSRPNNSVDPIYDWSSNILQVDLNRPTRLVENDTESILVNTLLFNTTWQTPMEKLRWKQAFNVKPYQTVDVEYIKGTIKNAIYLETRTYALVAVPLHHKSTYLYILLPNGFDISNYNIRAFSESFDNYQEFQNSIEQMKEIRNVILTVPNIFSRFEERDLVKPLLNFINDENMNNENVDDIYLNMAANDLKINKALQHVYFSIENKLDSTVKSTINPEIDAEHPMEFNVTRPFVFIVMDQETNIVFLWGSISDPQKLQK